MDMDTRKKGYSSTNVINDNLVEILVKYPMKKKNEKMIWELDTYDFGSQDVDIYNIDQNIVHRIEQNGNDFGS